MRGMSFVLVLVFLAGCTGARIGPSLVTTGSPNMDTDWVIAPRLDMDEIIKVPKGNEKISYQMKGWPAARELGRKEYLAVKLVENGGQWTIADWTVGSLGPSITIMTKFYCPPGAWGNLDPADVKDRKACVPLAQHVASEGGWVKPIVMTTLAAGGYIAGQYVRRPDQVNVNQSGAGASASGGNARQGQGQGQGQSQGQSQGWKWRGNPKPMPK